MDREKKEKWRKRERTRTENTLKESALIWYYWIKLPFLLLCLLSQEANGRARVASCSWRSTLNRIIMGVSSRRSRIISYFQHFSSLRLRVFGHRPRVAQMQIGNISIELCGQHHLLRSIIFQLEHLKEREGENEEKERDRWERLTRQRARLNHWLVLVSEYRTVATAESRGFPRGERFAIGWRWPLGEIPRRSLNNAINKHVNVRKLTAHSVDERSDSSTEAKPLFLLFLSLSFVPSLSFPLCALPATSSRSIGGGQHSTPS